jgi:hypothetical protein
LDEHTGRISDQSLVGVRHLANYGTIEILPASAALMPPHLPLVFLFSF